MIYLILCIIAIPAPVIFIFNSETIAIVMGLKGHHFLIVSAAIALGQTIGFCLLYYFGQYLVNHWQSLHNRLQRFDLEKFHKQGNYLICCGALTGLPPLNIMSILASRVGIPISFLAVVTFFMRWLRYAILAGMPQFFVKYIDTSILPDWLNP
jgi:membrane protein YqaA with SNARE-associated domain